MIDAEKILKKEDPHPGKGDELLNLFKLVDKIGYLYFSKTLKWGELIYFLPHLELLRKNKANAEEYADDQGFLCAKYLIGRYDKEYHQNKAVHSRWLNSSKFRLQDLKSTLLEGEESP